MSIETILLLIALVLFILAAIGVAGGRINLVAAGLAFATAAVLLPGL